MFVARNCDVFSEIYNIYYSLICLVSDISDFVCSVSLWSIMLSLLLASLCLCVSVCQQLGVTVFKPGEGGYPCIRIPSITSTPSGTLIAFAECRGWIGDGCEPQNYNHSELSNIQANVNLRWVCQKTSTDQGKTWSNLSFPVGLNYTSMEPTIVYDYIENKLILHVNVFLGEPNETIYQVTSTDDGKTWSNPLDIGHLYLGSDANLIVGPGNAVQLLNDPKDKYYGRILFIGYKENPFRARVYYSDDYGKTYTLSPTVLENMSESSLAQLNNGSVVANMRNSNDVWKCKCRGIAMSNDGGTTFTAPYPDTRLSTPTCQGSIITVNNGSILLFSNPDNKDSRINMTVHKSMDNGVSWSKEYELCAECGAAYSDLTAMTKLDGYFGLLWETNITNCIGPSCQSMFSLIPTNF